MRRMNRRCVMWGKKYTYQPSPKKYSLQTVIGFRKAALFFLKRKIWELNEKINGGTEPPLIKRYTD
jgi:hypothetical protein